MIQVIHRALNILELVASDKRKIWSLSEIADTLGLNRGTCANIIKTLVQRGYIEQEDRHRGYSLGYRIYKLVNSEEYMLRSLQAMKPYVNALRDTLNENIILSVISNDMRILVYEAECTHELSVRTIPEMPVYRATTGRLILAHYQEKQLEAFISKTGLPSEVVWPAAASREGLLSELENIRKQDVYVTINSNHVAGLAAPVFKKDRVIASLGIYLPDVRYTPYNKDIIKAELLKTASDINEALKQ